MGGPGSGRRWHYGAKVTTEESLAIDVRRWNRERLIADNRIFQWQWFLNDILRATIDVDIQDDHVTLSYTYRKGKPNERPISHSVNIERTKCHLGGNRPWFICPVPACGKRVAKLYCAGIFMCRECAGLSYKSQNEGDFDRAARRANSIRQKLGWVQGALNKPQRIKPKGMHHSTYQRLTIRHDYFLDKFLTGITAYIDGSS